VKIDDAADIATKATQAVLEDMVRTKRGEWNFGAMMMTYRGDDPVAMLVLPPNKEALLQTAMIAARGFGPDTLVLTHDSFVTVARWKDSLDPRTGKHWAPNPGGGPGPLQTYVDEFGYDGTVVDCLVTHVVNRAGDVRVKPRPYEVDGRAVKWLDFIPDDTSHRDDGVRAALQAYMGMSTLDQALVGELPPWAAALAASDPERARWAYDMVTATVIEAEIGSGVSVALYARNGSPRHQMLRKRFPRSQVIDPSRWN
jgi:hypothetical protein